MYNKGIIISLTKKERCSGLKDLASNFYINTKIVKKTHFAECRNKSFGAIFFALVTGSLWIINAN